MSAKNGAPDVELPDVGAHISQFDWTPAEYADYVEAQATQTVFGEVAPVAVTSPADDGVGGPNRSGNIDAPGPSQPKDTSILPPPFSVVDPPHYRQHPSGVECISITEHLGFCLGNAVKYLWRAGLKDETSIGDDLRKSIWYIRRELHRIGEEE